MVAGRCLPSDRLHASESRRHTVNTEQKILTCHRAVRVREFNFRSNAFGQSIKTVNIFLGRLIVFQPFTQNGLFCEKRFVCPKRRLRRELATMVPHVLLDQIQPPQHFARHSQAQEPGPLTHTTSPTAAAGSSFGSSAGAEPKRLMPSKAAVL